MTFSYYPLLLIAGIVLSYMLWAPRVRKDPRLLPIYGAALFGAFAGAKLADFAAEGFLYIDHPQRWWFWAAGKTILGALLGGYVAVEWAKKSVGYTQATGDLFALAAPVGIILGRFGCLLHGCCAGLPMESAWWTTVDAHGVARWPAVPAEIAFNVAALACFIILRNRGFLPGQHFHLYLMGYGLFRFAHEFLRATPRLWGTFSGYHLVALAVAVLGAVGFARRWASRAVSLRNGHAVI